MTAARVALACVLILTGCERAAQNDSTGALRIVSLAPHLTELVYTVGAGDALVGVVAYSDYPEAARALPQIGDAFRVDFEQLARLAPTLVLAWEGGNPAALVDELRSRGYRVEALRTGELDNIAANIRRVGELTGREADATRIAADFLAALQGLRAANRETEKLKVFFQIDRQPLYTVGNEHTIGQVVELCGGQNIFADLPALAAAVDVESVVAADPQVLMTTGAATELDDWRRFDQLRAVQRDHLFGVTADHITRDSVRILDGAREVCAHLNAARRSSRSAP